MDYETNFCRLCLKEVMGGQFERFNDVEKPKQIVNLSLLRLDSLLINNPLICYSCLECLKDYYNFIMDCREVEGDVVSYFNNRPYHGDYREQVDLMSVRKFTMKKRKKQREVEVNNPLKFRLNLESKGKILSEERGEGSLSSSENQIDLNESSNVVIKKEFIKCEMEGANLNDSQDNVAGKSVQRKIVQSKLTECDKDRKQPGIFYCEMCPFKTKRRSSLYHHKLTHRNPEEIEVLECAMCTFETKYRRHLYAHEVCHKSPEESLIFECDLCTYKTDHKKYLERHVLVHENRESTVLFECDLCNFKSERESSLTSHKSIHENPEEIVVFECDLCTYKSKYKWAFKRHKAIHKPAVETKLFECDKCTFKTKCKRYVETHKLTHIKSELLKCDQCTYTTKHMGYFGRHKMMHTKTELFECEFCNYKGKQRSSLTYHKLLFHQNQEGTPFFYCEKCSYKTKYKGGLKTHSLIHKNA